MSSFVSVTSAFLVVVHLASKQLPNLIANLALALYLFASIFFVVNFQRSFTMTIAIRDYMMSSNMSWYPAVTEPRWIMPSTMWIGVIVMSVLAAGAIWYFLSKEKLLTDV